MTVIALDHVNIRTPDVPKTIAFLRDVLAMAVTAPPGSSDTNRGGWAYDKAGNAVLHVSDASLPFPESLAAGVDPERQHGSGMIHHVAVRCDDYEETRSRLLAQGMRFGENEIASMNLRQLFVGDGNGILFELNFTTAQATQTSPPSL